MRTSTKYVGALAVAGVVAAAGSAMTATGVTTTGNAALPQFVGGTVSQAVTGATLNNIAYTFVGGPTGPKTHISGMTLTFTDANADQRQVTATPTSSPVDADVFTCGTVSGTTATCTVGGNGYSGLTSMSITVDSSQ